MMLQRAAQPRVPKLAAQKKDRPTFMPRRMIKKIPLLPDDWWLFVDTAPNNDSTDSHSSDADSTDQHVSHDDEIDR